MIDWDNIAKTLEGFCAIERDKPFKELTSLGVGGPAKIVATPHSREELSKLMEFLWSENLTSIVIGKGTNLLASDNGYDGVVIRIDGGFEKVERLDEGLWLFEAGCPLESAIRTTAEAGYAGLENLAGIPGSVGGAVRMNASAYETSFFDRIEKVELLVYQLGFFEFPSEKLSPEYRSIDIPANAIIISTTVKLEPIDSGFIQERIDEKLSLRAETQPISERSAGCIFKNPSGLHAGKLIEDTGLKGFKVGDAMISHIHANFIVNAGNATADDIMKLIEIISNEVEKKFAVELELEIKVIPGESS